MSFAEAMRRANEVRTSLLDHGVQRVSIELQMGRPGTPNERWFDTRFATVLSHHTVSRPSDGLTPCLALCKLGKGGAEPVPGPLCNGYGGYDRVYRILCMGWANHPGEGGPWTASGVTIPRDNARPYAWGTEYEGGILVWTDEMHEFMARANAGLIDISWIANGNPERHGEHKTWAPDRKVDRLDYTTASGRTALIPFLNAHRHEPEDDDDMMYSILGDSDRGGPAVLVGPLTFRPIGRAEKDALVKAGLAKNEIRFLTAAEFDLVKAGVNAAVLNVAAKVDAGTADDFAALDAQLDVMQETADEIAAAIAEED